MYMEDSLDAPVRDVLRHMQARIMGETSYFGVKTLKNPLDFWVYQEIICETKPDVIIEIGNNWGGSTLALAHVLDGLQQGRVIGIDIDQGKIPNIVREHPRITLIEAPATEAYELAKEMIASDEQVLVIEDSAHTYENTLAVLRRYGELVKPGGYIIVEDTICHHGLEVGPQPGPYEAVERFLSDGPPFELDRGRESFFITWNPKGFLRKVS